MKDNSKYGKESIAWKSEKIFIQRVNIEIEVQLVKFSEPEQLANEVCHSPVCQNP